MKFADIKDSILNLTLSFVAVCVCTLGVQGKEWDMIHEK